MKRFVVMVLVLVILMVGMTACGSYNVGNRTVAGKDVQTFTYAYIRLGDKDIVQGYITQWRDYEDSDVVQLLIDGKYYLTHYSCVVMIADPSHGNLGYGTGELN